MAAHYPITPEDRERSEAILLGSLLLHPEGGATVRAILQPEDFTQDRHRLIYEALQTVLGTPELDTIQAVGILLTEQELERMGGVAYLTALKRQVENITVPIENQASLLKQASLHRLLNQVGEAIRTRTAQYDGDGLMQVIGDLEHAIRFARQLLSPNNTLPPHIVPLQEVLCDYLDDLADQDAVLTGIPTGFADLDAITGGLQRSDLIIIAGPPSVGKTGFALSIALHVLLQANRSVGLFSLEASRRRVIQRLLSMEANLDQRLLYPHAIEDERWDQLRVASKTLMERKLWIDDTVSLSTTQLFDTARFLVERCGVELLIVDYVHLMLSSINDKRHENRVQEIGEISRSLKALARELNIPVLALAQLSRAFESRPLKKFQLTDLRDGSLENDADVVLFLSLAEVEATGTTAVPQLATISIAKHRTGPLADLDVCFQSKSTRFHDLPRLSQTSSQEQLSSSVPTPPPSDQPRGQLPRLVDILEQAVQRQPRQEKPKTVPKSSSHRRELPQGYVLDDEELESESEPNAAITSFVDEQEQKSG